MTILFKLLRKGAGRSMDPLHVSMTGVRMGERFLQIGCDDRSLLAGLASKVGLSGLAAVAVFDEAAATRARAIGGKVGALIEVRSITDSALPFEENLVDMVVIDDTRGRFAALENDARMACLRDAHRVVRPGGRVEIVEGLGGSGWFGSSLRRPADYDSARELAAAGFKPVRLLAERDGFRFVEGLRGIS